MRNLLIALTVSAITAVAAQTANAQAQGIYDPDTGDLVISGFSNLGGLRLAGPGVPANSPDALGGFADESIPGEVSWLFFAPKNETLGVGPLLPTDLFQSQFDQDEYQAFWVETGAGGNQVPIAITGGLTEVIPEPGTIALAGLGLIGLGLVRRRRG